MVIFTDDISWVKIYPSEGRSGVTNKKNEEILKSDEICSSSGDVNHSLVDTG